MAKKRKDQPERFSASQYFTQDDGFCPFKDVKLKPKTEPAAAKPKAKPISPKVYDLFTPSSENVVQKVEQLPLTLLRECSPQESLDLHGKKPGRDDIAELVKDFLDDAVSKGRRKVEIIVGKGNHSNGEPVIPQLVEAVLGNSPVVRDFETAPANKGGSGAFWVILGKKPAASVNIYASRKHPGTDIKGAEKVNLSKPAKAIDYDSYLPEVDDILDKF